MTAILIDPKVPFTNNHGEENIRMIQVEQRIGGCIRTLVGAQVFARDRSHLSTCQTQGHDREVCRHLTFGRPFRPRSHRAGLD